MWTLSGLRVLIVWAINLGKVGYVYSGSGHKNLSTQTKEGEGYLPAEDESRGAPFIGQVGRPGPTGLGWFDPPGSALSPSTIIYPPLLSCPRAPRVAPPKCSRPLLFLHYWSFHLMFHALSHVHAPLLHLLHMSPWISCKLMLAAHPCLSFACGPDEIVERASNGACMINFN
jgi:hypothetical protein